jgi:hypothetical protein
MTDLTRAELEAKVEAGIHKAMKEYKETFDILAEYDINPPIIKADKHR